MLLTLSMVQYNSFLILNDIAHIEWSDFASVVMKFQGRKIQNDKFAISRDDGGKGSNKDIILMPIISLSNQLMQNSLPHHNF